MPTLDADRGVLVIRIVYDGPALSGKTTSVRALAEGVSRPVSCPEEREGRTVYFDWLDYVGGLFEGRPIRCQIVSVPGQRELAARRSRLLESADAVVCVLDTRTPELSFGLEWLGRLVPLCRATRPPVGIVLQANKRDACDAVPGEELRTRVQTIAPVAIVESVATSSSGTREAFVLAVRLALDRVRALSDEGQLPLGPPREDHPDDLMRALELAESPAPPHAPDGALPDTRAARPRTPAPRGDEPVDERLFAPDPTMPGGMIWPPVDGRALLHEVASLGIRPYRTPRGDWWGSGSGWRFFSSRHALFHDAGVAHGELLAWARLHAASDAFLSPGRAVILADAGAGRLRLWQLVRVEAVLRERLAASVSSADPSLVAQGLVGIAARLLAARTHFRTASPPLPCTLWTVGARDTSPPRFVGLMPELGASVESELSPSSFLRREISPHLRELRRGRLDYPQIAREVLRVAETADHDSPAQHLGAAVRAIE